MWYCMRKPGLAEKYLRIVEKQDKGSSTVNLQGEEVAKVEDFKYLGSTV